MELSSPFLQQLRPKAFTLVFLMFLPQSKAILTSVAASIEASMNGTSPVSPWLLASISEILHKDRSSAVLQSFLLSTNSLYNFYPPFSYLFSQLGQLVCQSSFFKSIFFLPLPFCSFKTLLSSFNSTSSLLQTQTSNFQDEILFPSCPLSCHYLSCLGLSCSSGSKS